MDVGLARLLGLSARQAYEALTRPEMSREEAERMENEIERILERSEEWEQKHCSFFSSIPKTLPPQKTRKKRVESWIFAKKRKLSRQKGSKKPKRGTLIVDQPGWVFEGTVWNSGPLALQHLQDPSRSRVPVPRIRLAPSTPKQPLFASSSMSTIRPPPFLTRNLRSLL